MISTQANLNLAVGRTPQAIKDALDTYAYNGDGSQLRQSLTDVLTEGHRQAAVIGRHRAGDLFPPEEDDRKFAQQVMRGEKPYLDALIRDITNGQYDNPDETANVSRMAARVNLYTRKMTGTANENFLLASDETEWTWKMAEIEDHCSDCPELSAGSPYTSESLPTVPGNNDTTCLFNCKCTLIRSDGRSGFAHPG